MFWVVGAVQNTIYCVYVIFKRNEKSPTHRGDERTVVDRISETALEQEDKELHKRDQEGGKR